MNSALLFPENQALAEKMSVELSTLMVTSKLITSYGKPLPFINKIKQQAMMQALRLENDTERL